MHFAHFNRNAQHKMYLQRNRMLYFFQSFTIRRMASCGGMFLAMLKHGVSLFNMLLNNEKRNRNQKCPQDSLVCQNHSILTCKCLKHLVCCACLGCLFVKSPPKRFHFITVSTYKMPRISKTILWSRAIPVQHTDLNTGNVRQAIVPKPPL